ncbi:MAG: BREX system P-loop protein BrxC [Snowella sp.]|nr:BREX system P-loop protein BrxC [Snowella sp.]
MKNRDVYQKDPATRKLVNEGVANVNDDRTTQALAVLRYELETFVCDGQYEKGMAHILDIYLKNIDQAEQPAVWVSGFYGSGKSHLVKMLRALWVDLDFEDGATARGIASLPQTIKDSFKELSTRAKRYGGLHAASGTLGAGASGSVRLALLRIIFKSLGLPEQYPQAKFVLWLKRENLYEQARNQVEALGMNWEEELDNLYVAEGLHDVLAQIKPNVFALRESCAEILISQYPPVQDISSDDLIKTIRQCLTQDGQLPLTLVVLDEIQQYIGEDNQRSMDVQEVVETCAKKLGGKLLFIGTGQTAVTGTSILKRLEGRFTVRVELSDADVDGVIRKVILAKTPEAKVPLENLIQTNVGEISRHLAGTTIGHRQGDLEFCAQDYPILPVRRRFWENALRVLDRTGTDSQLRNQLSMIHKAIQTNLDEPLGHIVPTDYLYFDNADKLLRGRILPRKVYEKTMTWIQGTEAEKLMARACSLVFLINKLNASNNEIGIRSTVDVLADLLVTDIAKGSSALRSQLTSLLDRCELLIRVGDEYRIQTEESAAWQDEFLKERNILANEAHRIDAERDDRLRQKIGAVLKRVSLTQGISKVTREVFPVFAAQLPADSDKQISIWIRDGWSSDENSVQADAREAGNQSPTIFVFIPKRSADDLRSNLITYKAAVATLENRGVPNTPEGVEARAAMDTAKQMAVTKINSLLDEVFSGARVFQGGGNEILGNNLEEMLLEAAHNSLQRLYPNFSVADHAGWSKVYERAHKGAPDALKAVGDDGEPHQNPVCKAILNVVTASKKGLEIRNYFEGSPYGWSRDVVDGGLQMLMVAGLIRAHNEQGKPVDPKDLERKAIGKTTFKREATTITTPQRIQIRKLLQKAGIVVKQGEELDAASQFLVNLRDLADRAGGEAPKPERPDTTLLEEIRLSAGNDQLLALYNHRDVLGEFIDQWSGSAEKIESRWPAWEQLNRLSRHAQDIPEAQDLMAQIEYFKQQRQLLADPDPVTPLLNALTQLLRTELNQYNQRYEVQYQQGLKALEQDAHWHQIDSEQKNALLSQSSLQSENQPTIAVQTPEDVLNTLERTPLKILGDRLEALPTRFGKVQTEVAKLREPESQLVQIPKRTLKTGEDIDRWVNEVKETLQTAIEKGPVIIQ